MQKRNFLFNENISINYYGKFDELLGYEDEMFKLFYKIDKELTKIFNHINPNELAKFCGNHCVQTAAAVAYILKKEFNIEPKICYTIITDTEGHYNHAFTVFRLNDNAYIVDVSRGRSEVDKLRYISRWPNFVFLNKDMIIEKYEDIKSKLVINEFQVFDNNELFDNQCEYFTRKPSKKMFEEVIKRNRKKIDKVKKLIKKYEKERS